MNRFSPKWLPPLLLTFFLLNSPLSATEVQEAGPEARAREIGQTLRCAVCQNQSVYDSNSDLAKDMLRLIREKIAAGESDQAIHDYFIQRYGDYITLEPSKQGSNLLLWLLPFLGLVAGGWALWRAVRRWTTLPPTQPPGAETASPASPPGGAMAERIQHELEQIRL